jgi:hypothetical protein
MQTRRIVITSGAQAQVKKWRRDVTRTPRKQPDSYSQCPPKKPSREAQGACLRRNKIKSIAVEYLIDFRPGRYIKFACSHKWG